MFGFLKPAPDAPPLPPSDVDRAYRQQRRRVFLGIFTGYAAYYLVRNNLALAIPDILKDYPQYSKAQLGTALTGLSIAYGLSKFLMGSVSDRSNPKYFLPLGLLLSCGIMFVSGYVKAIYSSLALLVVLQTLNGWVQGMGWPPCGKSMVHWWSTRERGLVVSTWNVAHNVGGALVANFALIGVTLFNDWGAKFYFNALLAAGVAVGLGTDGSASNNDLSLWEEMDSAAKLHKVTSGDPTVLDARTVLAMATRLGATAIGMQQQIGSLEPGKRADLILVRTDAIHQIPSYDPYSLLVYSTKAEDVDTAIIDGQVVMAAGRVLTVDERAVRERTAAYQERIAAAMLEAH